MNRFDDELDRLSRGAASGMSQAGHAGVHDAAIVVHEMLGLARASLHDHFGAAPSAADAIALLGCMLTRWEQWAVEAQVHGTNADE